MAIRRKIRTASGRRRAVVPLMSRDALKANLERFRLMASAAAQPAAVASRETPAARPAGEILPPPAAPRPSAAAAPPAGRPNFVDATLRQANRQVNQSVQEARATIQGAQNVLRRDEADELKAVAEAQRIAERATANLQRSEQIVESATSSALKTLQAGLGNTSVPGAAQGAAGAGAGPAYAAGESTRA
ncbi:MAG TPA: hypothetical protein VGR96_02805 [Acidobacteriaceae bacterium]|nr:hypothetical protein [Acidobacteriaceae bacterium]